MQTVLLAALSAYLAWGFSRWLADWRRGQIRRFPRRDVFRDAEPHRFHRWSAIHGAFYVGAWLLLALAWTAHLDGRLH